MPELNNFNTSSEFGCSRAFKACAIVSVLILAVVVGLVIYILNIPQVQETIKCRKNMTEIAAAIERYHAKNNEYPPNLAALKPKYLKDVSILRCPLDRMPGEQPSYIYHRPKEDSKPSFILLECSRHTIRKDKDAVTLQLLLNGEIKIKPNKKNATNNN